MAYNFWDFCNQEGCQRAAVVQIYNRTSFQNYCVLLVYLTHLNILLDKFISINTCMFLNLVSSASKQTTVQKAARNVLGLSFEWIAEPY